jgi:hypothetical protein
VAAKAHEAATSPLNGLPEPTEAQKEAGNYHKGHIKVHGMDISIENPAGSKRRPEWNPLEDHYGYIKGTVGKDKDHVDVFINRDNPESDKVFVVNQVNPKTGKFDEHKAILGANSQEEADAIYHRNYQPGWNGRESISEMTVDQFKEWVKSDKTKSPAPSPAPAPPSAKPTHTAIYDGKEISSENFKQASQRVQDNLKAGDHGYVRTPDGTLFEISREKKSAVRVKEMRTKNQRDISMLEEQIAKEKYPNERKVLGERLAGLKGEENPDSNIAEATRRKAEADAEAEAKKAAKPKKRAAFQYKDRVKNKVMELGGFKASKNDPKKSENKRLFYITRRTGRPLDKLLIGLAEDPETAFTKGWDEEDLRAHLEGRTVLSKADRDSNSAAARRAISEDDFYANQAEEADYLEKASKTHLDTMAAKGILLEDGQNVVMDGGDTVFEVSYMLPVTDADIQNGTVRYAVMNTSDGEIVNVDVGSLRAIEGGNDEQVSGTGEENIEGKSETDQGGGVGDRQDAPQQGSEGEGVRPAQPADLTLEVQTPDQVKAEKRAAAAKKIADELAAKKLNGGIGNLGVAEFPGMEADLPLMERVEEPKSKTFLPAPIIKQLLSMPPEMRTAPYGDRNASLRQDILEAITGTRPPKSKAGVNVVQDAMLKAAGISKEGKAPVQYIRELVAKMQKEVGAKTDAETDAELDAKIEGATPASPLTPGSRVKLGKQITPFEVLTTPDAEGFFDVKNVKTGEVQKNVTMEDIRYQNEDDGESNEQSTDAITGRPTRITGRVVRRNAARAIYLESKSLRQRPSRIASLGSSSGDALPSGVAIKIGSGNEVVAYRARNAEVVYKVFGISPRGEMGSVHIPQTQPDGTVNMVARSGTFDEMLAKVEATNRMGGVPTEIVGVTKDGELIVKQPYSPDSNEYEFPVQMNQSGAVQVPYSMTFRSGWRIWIVSIDGRPMLVTDLLHGNFRPDSRGNDRVSDLSITPVPATLLDNPKWMPLIQQAIANEKTAEEAITSFQKSTSLPRASLAEAHDQIAAIAKSGGMKVEGRLDEGSVRLTKGRLTIEIKPYTGDAMGTNERILDEQGKVIGYRIGFNTETGAMDTIPHEILGHIAADTLTDAERMVIRKVLGMDMKSWREVDEKFATQIGKDFANGVEHGTVGSYTRKVWDKVKAALSNVMKLRFGDAWGEIAKLPNELRAERIMGEVMRGERLAGSAGRIEGGVRNAKAPNVTPAQDAAYLAAVERGDTAEAQRMVDEAAKEAGALRQNGYHFSNNDFNVFDNKAARKKAFDEYMKFTSLPFEERAKISREKGRPELNPGWTTDYGQAYVFPDNAHFFFLGNVPEGKLSNTSGKKVKKVFLAPKNILDLTSSKLSSEETKKIAEWMQKSYSSKATPGEWGHTVKGDALGGFRAAKKSGVTPKQLYDFVNTQTLNERAKTWRKLMDEFGYDAVKFESNSSGTTVLEDLRGPADGKTYTTIAMLDPSQIKSADPITRDDKGRIIPLSERFNEASADIRYQREEDADGRPVVRGTKAYDANKREEYDLPPAVDQARRTWPQAHEEATTILSRNPKAGIELVSQLAKHPRPLTDAERVMLVIEKAQYERDADGHRAKALEHKESGATLLFDSEKLQAEIAQSYYEQIADALKASGSESGRSLAAIKMSVDYEFQSLSTMLNRARAANDYNPISDAQVDEVTKIHDQYKATIKQLETEIARMKEDGKNSDTGKVIDRMKGEKKPADPEAVHEKTLDKIRKKAGEGYGFVPPEGLFGLFQQLARYHVGKGVVEREALVEAVRKDVEPILPYMTNRQVRDAISQYGKTSEMSQEDVDVTLRELKRQMTGASKIDDVLKGKAPLKSGVIRDPISQISREQSRELHALMKKMGVRMTDPATQLKSSLDAIKTRLTNSIEDLTQAIAKHERMVTNKDRVAYDAQANALKAERDALRAEYDLMFPREPITDAQRLIIAKKSAERSLADWQAKVAEAEKGVFPDKAQKAALTNPEIDAIRAQRDAAKAEFEALQELANPKPSPEVVALNRYKAEIARAIERYEKQLANPDFTKKVKADRPMDDGAINALKKLNALKSEWKEKKKQYERDNASWTTKTAARIHAPFNMTRKLLSSMDLSATLRQGGFIVFGHPIRALDSFFPSLKSLVSENETIRIDQEIKSRPNAGDYIKAKLFIAEHEGAGNQTEENYRRGTTRWEQLADKTPGVKQSQRAYTTFLNKLRADSFDAMVQSLHNGEKPTLEEMQKIASFINIATGRGEMGKAAVAGQTLSDILWSPRLMVSRFQLLSGQPVWGGTAATRKLIAIDYARFLGGMAAVYALGAMAGGEEEPDPRSADFGKIKFGNTRLDPMAGLAQVTTVSARIVTGRTKTAGGEVEKLRGEDAAFGSGVTGVIGRFLRAKLSPMVGIAINVASGSNAVGEKSTPLNVARDMVSPLAFRDVSDIMLEHGIGPGTAIMMLSTLGIGAQNYQNDQYKSAVKSLQIGNKELNDAKTDAERQAIITNRPYIRQREAISNLNSHINKMESVIKILNERAKTAPVKDQAAIGEQIARITAQLDAPKQKVIELIRGVK